MKVLQALCGTGINGTVIGCESVHMDVILCGVREQSVFLWGDTARSLGVGEPASRSRAVEQPAGLRLLPLNSNDLKLVF